MNAKTERPEDVKEGRCEGCRSVGPSRLCMLDSDGSECYLCVACQETLEATTWTRSLQEYEREYNAAAHGK